jgi:hypothetical protein
MIKQIFNNYWIDTDGNVYNSKMEKLFIPAHQKELWEKIKPKIYKQTEFDFY